VEDCYGNYDNDSKYCRICCDKSNCKKLESLSKGDNMGLKKKKKVNGKKSVKKATGKKKTTGKEKTKEKEVKKAVLTRKGYILKLVKDAGAKGVKVDTIIEKTDSKFDYEEGKSSRMRVNNTLKQAADDGKVKVTDSGKAIWKG